MRRALVAFVAGLTLLGTVVVAAPAHARPAASTAPPAPAPPAPVAPPALHDGFGLHVVSVERRDERTVDVTVTTPALAAPTTFRVLLPVGYDASPRRRYPVLYLLHGHGGSYLDWTLALDATKTTAPYGVITVMPDGGRGGFYANWSNFGKGGPPEWETYHIDQLLPFIDASFRTIPNRTQRAIAGLSMGGFGAVSYAVRHPDLFGASASFSGALDASYPAAQTVVDVSAADDGAVPGQAFGFFAQDPLPWYAHDPLSLAANLRNIRIATYTNDGNPAGDLANIIEFWSHATFESFNAELTRLGVPHTAVDNGPGSHTADHWAEDLRLELPHIMDTFAHPVALPSPLSYESYENAYVAWDWGVLFDRPTLQRSTLTMTSNGFELTGSGSALVVTSAHRFHRNRKYTIRVRTADGSTQMQAVRASGNGRLVVKVPLGPPTTDRIGSTTTTVTVEPARGHH